MQAELFSSEDDIYDLLKHIYIKKGYKNFRDYYDQFIESLIKMDQINFSEHYLSAERAYYSVLCEQILSAK